MLSIYAQENGEGMVFTNKADDGAKEPRLKNSRIDSQYQNKNASTPFLENEITGTFVYLIRPFLLERLLGYYFI